MTTVTLETIKAEQAAEREQVHFPETLIDLNPGEHYAGLIVGNDGAPSYHLILLPGEAENVTFVGAEKWATGIGGDLPLRREQSLLYANLKDEFQDDWYWSGEANASESGWAWYQYFGYGYQSNGLLQDYPLRARAVRRLPI